MNSKFDIDEFIKAWFLSALVYRIRKPEDADDFINLVEKELYMYCHVSILDGGAQICGVAHGYNQRNKIYAFHRGTGGFDFWSKIRSWGADLDISTGDDHQHDGFQKYGNRSFDSFRSYFENAQTVTVCGHSQGAGVAQRLAWLLCRLKDGGKLNGLKSVLYHLFSAPPAGECEFAYQIAAFESSGLCQGWRCVMPGDPIASPALRNEHSILLDGVDIGQEISLPEIILQEYWEKAGPVTLINHSPRLQTAAMLPMLLRAGATIGQLKFLDRIRELTVS